MRPIRNDGRHGDARPWRLLAIALLTSHALAAPALADSGSGGLRHFIAGQVGGLDTLKVPARDADLPQPRLVDGTPDPQFATTEAKRYLGKQLFHDPVRMVRILPEFGGVPATAQTASCGSCHFGEAASKAGTLLNFAAGGEGRGYTDAQGHFVPRRRPRLDLLTPLRTTPLFPGDALVDELPTLTDVYQNAVGSPARGRKQPDPGPLLRTGRLDALDSVARNAPGVLGAAFNNRLLLGGFAGEPDASPGGLNPFGFVAQESVALLLLDAHRLLDLESGTLAQVAVYRKLFRDAFPTEAAQAAGCVPESPPAPGACDVLINDITVLRATATFMRTVVTRNTPFDRFLAGDNRALSPAQQRGARLFFTKADKGGAGCFGCHSGPMLNKQPDDPDVTGAGRYVEENFFNLGLADHPLQALNRKAYNDPAFRDTGRQEITGRADDAFKFRVNTLRQLKDARLFFHNGSFTSVRDVVRYFNAGIPQDTTAGAAATLSARFTNPRGPGSAPGLGLSERQIDDLTDFLENGLYDTGFVRHEPWSGTRMFQLSPKEVTYSVYRPDLAALGAVDGRPGSGLPQDNNDPLSRRDMGLEFLDVTAKARIGMYRTGRNGPVLLRIANRGSAVIDTHLLVVVQGLPEGATLANASGMTRLGEPYLRLYLDGGELKPGQRVYAALRFSGAEPSGYSLRLLSGQGTP